MNNTCGLWIVVCRFTREVSVPRRELQVQSFRQGVVIGLVLMAVLIPLSYSFLLHDYRVSKLVILQVFTVFLAVLWVVGMALDREIFLLDTPLYYTFLAFLAVQLISLFQAHNVFQGLDTLFEYLCYFLIAVLVFHTVREERHLYLLAGTMALTGSIVAIIGLLQHNGIHSIDFFGWWAIPFYSRWNIPISTIGNVNFVAGYYNVVFPISLTLMFLFRRIWLRVAALLACFLMACHFVVLGSRGGWLGVAIVFFVLGGMVLMRHFRIGHRVLDMTFVSIVILGLGWPVLEGLMSGVHVGPGRNLERLAGDYWKNVVRRTEDALRRKDDSSLQRWLFWMDTLRLIYDRPLVGVGVGNFEYNFPRYMSPQTLKKKMDVERIQKRELMLFRAHNEYLEVWAETGILGFGVFLFLLYQIGAALYGLLKRYLWGEVDLFVVGLTGAIAATLAHSLFSSNLQDPASASHFWIVVGMVWSLKLNTEGETRIGLLATKAGGVVFGVVGAGILALVGTIVLGLQTIWGSHYFLRGMHWFENKAYAEAGAEFQQAVRYRHLQAFAVYEALGRTRYNQKRWDEAVQAFQKSLLYHENNDKAHYYLGLSLRYSGKYQEAVAQLRRAVELNPFSGAFRLELGNALGLAGDPQAAVEELQGTLRLYPNAPEVYHALGGNYKRAGDLEAAVEAYEQAIALRPGDPEILNSLAAVYLDQSNFEGAHQIFQRLVGEWPARPDYRANLGVALFFLGQPEAALAACAQALKIDPDFARAYGIMGSIFEDAGDRSQAQRAYREALKRDPNDPKVRGRLRALEEKC